MSASKLAELNKELTNSAFPCNRPDRLVLHLETVIEVLDKMALRVFEDTAKVADEHTRKDYSWECSDDFRKGYEQAASDIAGAIRAMQPAK